jgi:methionine-R-sulfoxide reductase
MVSPVAPVFHNLPFGHIASLQQSVVKASVCTKKAQGGNETMSKPFDKPNADELKKKLSPLQFQVTQEEGTERPFQNAFWDNKAEGIYVDVVSGEPLFSSLDKFDSGTGWPSFTRPLAEENIVTKTDHKLFSARTEVRSRAGDSHLGHLFPDGPQEAGGMRYCMNSASLRFVPKDKLEAEGFGKYAALFQKEKS